MAMPVKLARTLVLTVTLATLGILANAPSALAYGRADQWQVGFSGTCSPQAPASFFCPGGISTGFWGWCAFGGSDGGSTVGTQGSTADCQLETYFGSGTSLHVNYNVTSWIIQPPEAFSFFLPDFLFKTGTITLSGPGVSTTPFPAHVPIPFPFGPPINGCPSFICDSGIPAVPGHYSLHPTTGAELNIQVTKLP
jgi:hypothetical protein